MTNNPDGLSDARARNIKIMQHLSGADATPPASTSTAIAAGIMKPWAGGPKPTDWTGEAVQFRSGKVRHSLPGEVWKLGWDHSYGEGDIIAYTAAAPKAASEDGATGLQTIADQLALAFYDEPVSDEHRSYCREVAEDLLAGHLPALALAASPTDATGAEMREAGQFLLDRLVDHEVRMTSEEDASEWHGHVTPAMARFRSAINLPVAGETL